MSMESTGDFAVSYEESTHETANQLTHGLGFLLTLLAAPVIMSTAIQTGGTLRVLGCSLYVFTLVGLYAASTLSHSFEDPDRKSLFRMWDQVFIFLFITASYTPYAILYLNSMHWWLLTAAMWCITFVGVRKRFASGPESMATIYFVCLASLPTLTLFDLASISGSSALTLVVFSGVSYIAGLYFFTRDHRHPLFHAVWHLCVISGSTFHFFFLLNYVAA